MNKRRLLRPLRLWCDGLANIIFPDVCTVCHRALVAGEKFICLECLINLPRTNFHQAAPNALLERLFSRGLPIRKATSLFFYLRGNPYVNIIHDTKYRRRPDVGRHLAQMHANELLKTDFFDGIDMLVPVPLHIIKRLTRGYNQAEEIAEAISQVSGIPVATPLKARYHRTQTRKDAHARFQNASGIYSISDTKIIEGKNLLLIDDVITTGATILACVQAIKAASPSSNISVYSLAATQLG